MSVITKSEPAGADKVIDRINFLLAENLYPIWGLSDSNSMFYNRVYRVSEDSGFIPVGFNSGSYKDVLFDDRKNCISFFYLSDSLSTSGNNENGMIVADCSHIMQVNLKNIYPDITWRADEEIRRDVCRFYDKEPLDVVLKSVFFTMQSVWSDFDIDFKGNEDMQPFLNLRFDITIKYRY